MGFCPLVEGKALTPTFPFTSHRPRPSPTAAPSCESPSLSQLAAAVDRALAARGQKSRCIVREKTQNVPKANLGQPPGQPGQPLNGGHFDRMVFGPDLGSQEAKSDGKGTNQKLSAISNDLEWSRRSFCFRRPRNNDPPNCLVSSKDAVYVPPKCAPRFIIKFLAHTI